MSEHDAADATVAWEHLQELAHTAMTHAYAPYSGYPVGAAAVTTDVRYVSGCNVENASYGLGLCAECGLISDLMRSGGGRLAAFVCVDGEGRLLTPCGRCRQLLFEHGGAHLKVLLASGVWKLGELLPEAFGPGHLEA
ncbi:cytidine deaminase [Bogoriella caseilytica]|uniref:Cytidine deaminase n=1 Tax=Bogoriella caseilytica TaxID=56055 RepID=A0A3N2BEL9_9MICO|nr:cytidine deaminase [Bogoriella caseilytica]ROR73682.1 cytidine deaminase [Bogoriella caseilytica]